MTLIRMVINRRPIRQYDLLKALRGRRIWRIEITNETVEVDAGNGFTKSEYTGRSTICVDVGP